MYTSPTSPPMVSINCRVVILICDSQDKPTPHYINHENNPCSKLRIISNQLTKFYFSSFYLSQENREKKGGKTYHKKTWNHRLNSPEFQFFFHSSNIFSPPFNMWSYCCLYLNLLLCLQGTSYHGRQMAAQRTQDPTRLGSKFGFLCMLSWSTTAVL